MRSHCCTLCSTHGASGGCRSRGISSTGSLFAFAALAVLYVFIPQSVLDGAADHKAIALGLRHDVVPVGAYFLGRSLVLRRDDLHRIGWTLLGVGAFVAALGIVDMYAVSINWWRTNGVIDYFHRHLGYDYHGTGMRTESNGAVYGLPENFIYNVGNDHPFLRRLVSTFLSPLASGYLFVVALLIGLRARVLAMALSVVVAAGLLFTFSRSSLVALAGALFVLAVLRRRPHELAAAAVVIAVAIGWAHLFPKIGPTGHFTKVDLTYQHAQAKSGGATGNFTAVSENEPSVHEHWTSLKDGVHTMVHHPQGYGLGNVGQTASRTGTPLKAGESNYTELGVELGVLGALLWIAWNLGALWLIRSEVRVAAAVRGDSRARDPNGCDRRPVGRILRAGVSSGHVSQRASCGRAHRTSRVAACHACSSSLRLRSWCSRSSCDRVASSAGRARRSCAHAGRAQPGCDASQHQADDLRARLDAHRASAGRLHERTEGEADARLSRARFAVGLPGGPPDQPRARRQPDGPPQSLARAVSACGQRRPDRERPEREGLQRRTLAG